MLKLNDTKYNREKNFRISWQRNKYNHNSVLGWSMTNNYNEGF